GICGTGMGSLAGLLKAAGHDVRGSDSDVYPPMSTQLTDQGIQVMDGYRPENLDWMPEMVVVGNVATKDHIEVAAAKERHLPRSASAARAWDRWPAFSRPPGMTCAGPIPMSIRPCRRSSPTRESR